MACHPRANAWHVAAKHSQLRLRTKPHLVKWSFCVDPRQTGSSRKIERRAPCGEQVVLSALSLGFFGIPAALFWLLFGGVGMALDADDARSVVYEGYSGLGFSILVITLGAISMGAQSRLPGALLFLSAIGGIIILEGTPVVIFMLLALVGGLLAVIGSKGRA